MAGDIERYMGSAIPALRERLEDRFPQPSALTEAGHLDRKRERVHGAEMRQIGRELERRTLQTYADVANEIVMIDGEAQLLEETKWRLERAKRGSAIIAGDDPELQAKFAVMDDDWFQHRRSRSVFGLDRT